MLHKEHQHAVLVQLANLEGVTTSLVVGHFTLIIISRNMAIDNAVSPTHLGVHEGVAVRDTPSEQKCVAGGISWA